MPYQQLGLYPSAAGQPAVALPGGARRERLAALLRSDLDFHDAASGYASHNYHSFPAKFPPQLPRVFIAGLTAPGDTVLDPMVGSGTTVVEALLAGRRGLGCDIDPLALLLCKVKATPLQPQQVGRQAFAVLHKARRLVAERPAETLSALFARLDDKAQAFIDYWFPPEAQVELAALTEGIAQVEDSDVRAFLKLAFSAVIITKSSSVSLARDLAHTRPHRVEGKTIRSPLAEFDKRLSKNLDSLRSLGEAPGKAEVISANAQALGLADAVADLIVTSPPYAANAIDYMRAHKFSLVWFGYPMDALSQRRAQYIGSDATTGFCYEPLAPLAAEMVARIAVEDSRKAQVLHRYYSEMTRALGEMYRVLKPDRSAVIVVGTSTMRGVDTRTQDCLAAIGEQIGFDAVGIAVRRLDRDRRMMPARWGGERSLQIEQRMHEEYVIGLHKPAQTDSAYDDGARYALPRTERRPPCPSFTAPTTASLPISSLSIGRGAITCSI